MVVSLRKMVPFALLIGIVSVQALTLSACNTAEGFGKDVENTGEKMQDGARETKQKL